MCEDKQGALTAVPEQPAGDGARGEVKFPHPRKALSSPADEHPDTDRDGENEGESAEDDTDNDPVF